MGSFIEINDTLQITKEQGFPTELDINKHLKSPIIINSLKEKVYKFSNKDGVRLFHQPPTRVFLVENINDKWIYWGLAHILTVHHDYIQKTTSGEYQIIHLNSPEEMRTAYQLIDQRPDKNYFA